MKQSLTKFSNDIIRKLIKVSASQIAGINEGDLSDDDIVVGDNFISVQVTISQNIINIKSVTLELQKKIYFVLSNQMDSEELVVDITVRN